MLWDLRRAFGEVPTCWLLGLPVQTFRGWMGGRRVPGAGIRAVWLVHCLALRPERVRSLFDLATWGRFRVERRAHEDGGEWSI